MKAILGGEADDFFESLSQPSQHAFHINRARMKGAAFVEWLKSQELLRACPLFDDSAWRLETQTEAATGIGHHPLHHAGALYSQDPAAMLPLLGLPISPDLRILDLCAAPGGKSSQLAQALEGGSGFLISNEIHPGRNKILVSNMERMGYRNVIVTSLEPGELADLYPGYFDLVVVDAPCSGEGMFRKYPESVNEWSIENVMHCRERGRSILEAAALLLRPGGRLVYSTCTFAPEENEEQVEWLCKNFGFHTDDAPKPIRDLALETAPGMFRCYPHRFAGEGQFAAYLKKEGSSDASAPSLPAQLSMLNPRQKKELSELFPEEAECFAFRSYKDRIVLLPSGPARLPDKKVTMAGVCVAVTDPKKQRLTPHHQFFSAYGNELKRQLKLSPGDARLADYLHGMELGDSSFSKGYGAVLALDVPLGGFRAAGGRLKNLYPKGLRE
ncbi:MAG: hypothetical protein IK115_14475 [Lachnospiraceae bacterium]|nr:hypothetical protein [Lachnospiraceae bacterium]